MLKLRKEIGITLVALIITIIILLILAGITIGELTGSGIFENAKTAKEKYENAQQDEQTKINEFYTEISETIEGGRANGDLASQTPGTATAADILKDKTAWVDGKQITGTLVNSYDGYNNVSMGSFEYTEDEAYIYNATCGFQPSYIFIVLKDLDSGNEAERYYDANRSTTKSFGRYFSGSAYEHTIGNESENSIYEVNATGFKYYLLAGNHYKITWVAVK